MSDPMETRATYGELTKGVGAKFKGGKKPAAKRKPSPTKGRKYTQVYG